MLDVVKVAALQSPMCGDVCLLGCFTGHLKGGDGVYGYFFGLTMIPTFAQRFFLIFLFFRHIVCSHISGFLGFETSSVCVCRGGGLVGGRGKGDDIVSGFGYKQGNF